MNPKLITEQVQDLRDLAANPRQRFPSGFPSLDIIMQGGPAAGEVVTFVGRSYTGKSLVATNIMYNNPGKGLIFFSLEMPASQVLQRMYAHIADIPGREVVRMVARNDLPDSLNYAFDAYERQRIVDDSGLSIKDMEIHIGVYAETFGEMPGCIIIDYLEEVGGGKQGTESRAEATASALKAFAKDQQLPIFLLHQANRTLGKHEPPTENSARYGGYTEADVMVGIWRPGEDPSLDEFVARGRKDDLSMNVIKNRINGRQNDEIHYTVAPSLRLVDLDVEKNRRFYGE